METTQSPHWIFSKKFDLTIFLTPLAVAALSPLCLLMEPFEQMPFWAFIVFMVSFDVAHVWASLYRTYMDKEEVARRKLLYFAPIPIFLLASFRIHYYSPVVFWTILAYVAIYHFIKQNYGFLALYKYKMKETSSFDFYLDKTTLWFGALGPVLWWHASPNRQFDWFNADEKFVFRLDPAFNGDIIAIYLSLLGLYVGRQIYRHMQGHPFNPGKQMIMAAHYLTWAIGIGFTQNPIISAAFINLFHGIPFMAIVWYYCNRKWAGRADKKGVMHVLSQKKNWLLFYLFVFVLAIGEEALWDGMVWQTYIPEFFNLPFREMDSLVISIWVAVLSLPQIMHYFLDGWIWRLNRSNPDLAQNLNLIPSSQ